MARYDDYARPTVPPRDFVSADVSVGGGVDALRFERDTPCPDVRVIMNAELDLDEAMQLFEEILDALFGDDS